MKLSLKLLFVILFITGCSINQNVTKVWIRSNQYLFYNDTIKDVQSLWGDTIIYKRLNQNADSLLVKKTSKGFLYKNTSGNVVLIVLDKKLPSTKNPKDSRNLFFFPNIASEKKITTELKQNEIPYYRGAALKYMTVSSVLQAISIPMKIRFKQDNFPTQINTSFNAGITYGFQFIQYKLRNEYYPNLTTTFLENKISFSIAGFGGLTPVTLTSSNTNNSIKVSEDVVGIDYGLVGVVSFNRLNFGLSLGCDTPLNKDGKNWIYNTKPWIGIVVGVDFLK